MIKNEQKFKRSKICKKYITDNLGKASLSIAKLIYKENKKDFQYTNSDILNIEYIRNSVRYFNRTKGYISRKNDRNLKLEKKLRYNYDENDKYIYNKEPEQYLDAKQRKLNKSKYYLITCAQNNSKLNNQFWIEMLAYAKFLKAEIHVILNRYKNPTSTFNDNDEYWDKAILPYADARRQKIHQKLEILSDIKVQPTAIDPLSGIEGISAAASCIIGHPKVHLKVIPALEGYDPKLMVTTGSVTKPNYTDSKAGKKGEFHHTYGFVIVEIKDSKTFFIRQVTASNDGSFTDLVHQVKGEKVKVINSISYMNIGDKHIGVHDPIVEVQQEKILNYFKPKQTIIHDVFNGTSVNHHIDKDPIAKYALQLKGDNLIKKEFENLFKWIQKWKKYNLAIISSNHNDWLDRYIKGMDWKKDIPNAMEYVKYAEILLSGKANDGLVACLIKEKFKDVKIVGRNESFKINNVELSQHGDAGVNGSRGHINSFRRLNTKMDIGHTHSPARMDGVMYVGTSTHLRQDYMTGASSHMSADIICHTDGKRQHIIYMGKNKEFTTFKF